MLPSKLSPSCNVVQFGRKQRKVLLLIVLSSNPLSLSLPLACNVVKIWRKLRSFMSLSSAPHTKTLSLPLVMLLVLFLPPVSLSLPLPLVMLGFVSPP
jgi:hypothetical protein